MREIEVAVVGAGAAGLAAARRLMDAGIDVIILEARERVGGRAWTDSASSAYPIDLGCEWLHSADENPFSKIARDIGFSIDKNPADWVRRVANYYGEAEQADWQKAREAFYARFTEPITEDRPASELLCGTRWDGLLNAISTWANGVELDGVSVRDYANYVDTGQNWRVLEGYGTLVTTYAKNLPLRLNTPVACVDHSGERISVVTSDGNLVADAVVITVPTNLLATERLRLKPQVIEKVEAAERLPLGNANKLFFQYNGSSDPERIDRHFAGATFQTRTGSYQLYPHGWPIVVGYFGGTLAVDLEQAGREAALRFAIEELTNLFGSNFCRSLVPIAVSGWNTDPWAGGSYSHALPMHANERSHLAAAIDDRLFFAGEACHEQFFTTTHGALLSGWRAADEVLAARTTQTFVKR
jgi:monoamine oxidase